MTRVAEPPWWYPRVILKHITNQDGTDTEQTQKQSWFQCRSRIQATLPRPGAALPGWMAVALGGAQCGPGPPGVSEPLRGLRALTGLTISPSSIPFSKNQMCLANHRCDLMAQKLVVIIILKTYNNVLSKVSKT